jgi:hypothetical protein
MNLGCKRSPPTHAGAPTGYQQRKLPNRYVPGQPPSRLLGLCALLAGLSIISFGNAAEPIDFNRQILPILSAHCYSCHGPDAEARQADLRLDLFEPAVAAGAIAPGDIGASQLVDRIDSRDPDLVMPPPDFHKPLSDQQRQLLRDWIAAGAEYRPHWAFLTPQRPDLPQPAGAAWARVPWDLFVLEQLEKLGLQPAPEADLATLVRRAALDVTGLPPTPDDLTEVLADPSPDAYARYVDRLLQRDSWGEHRTRYWLDYARYGDTHGIHIDNYREIWAYRDWLIQAFNRNLPFDQFTIEQLAGDLLPEPTLDQRIATGFNRCNITTSEGGAIDEEYLALYTLDRTETTSLVWLGLTAGCSACHDHKFDPLSQAEFYQLAAFFNNTTQPAMDGNVQNTPPVIAVPLASDRDRYAELQEQLQSGQQQLAGLREAALPRFHPWLAQAADELHQLQPADGLQHQLLEAPLSGHLERGLPAAAGSRLVWGEFSGEAIYRPGHIAAQAWVNQEAVTPVLPTAGDFDVDQPFSVSLWLQLASPGQSGAVLARMDEENSFRGWDVWLEGGRIGLHLIHSWPDNAVKVISQPALTANRWQHVLISYAGDRQAHSVRIHIDGRPVPVQVQTDSLSGTTRTTVPLRIGRRHVGSGSAGVAVQDLRLFDAALTETQLTALTAHQRPAFLARLSAADRTPEQLEELFQWFLRRHDSAWSALEAQLSQWQTELRAIETAGTIAHIMQERATPAEARLLFRGQYDQPRETVQPGTPGFLPPMPETLPRNRLGLAHWLLMEGHPLTARVTVNRFWQEVFGQGLVPTSGDFGISGLPPSHPELLDYLAITFREGGWDIKDLFRQFLTSATYRQSARLTAELLKRDPNNQWLARGPRFRMDAEMVRDCALSVSGLLSSTIGGPSVKPYQPPGVWEAVAMPNSNTRNYQADSGEGLYRRSMYWFWKRSAPPASMEIFNAPSRETCVIQRERTNTPLQALVTLNDPQFVEAARHLAYRHRMWEIDSDQVPDRSADLVYLTTIWQQLMSRQPNDIELETAADLLPPMRSYYRQSPDQAAALLGFGDSPTPVDSELQMAELAAWTAVVNTLMNLDEVLCK